MNNVALNKSAAGSAAVPPFSPARAVNGSFAPTSRWLCGSVPAWILIDLGQVYWINRWRVTMMPCLGWYHDCAMSDFRLQRSLDGNSWAEIDAVVNNSQSKTDRAFVPRRFRFMRVLVTKGLRGNAQVASILELEAYEAETGPFLSGLALSQGTLSPTFDSETFAYSTVVSSTTQTITVTPSALFANTSIKVNGNAVTSGQASPAINVEQGAHISVEVASSDGAVAHYTIDVTKPATSDYLSGLAVAVLRSPLNPPFARDTYAYTGLVMGGVESVTVTPTAEDSKAIIKVNGVQTASGGTTPVPLIVGQNRIEIKVATSVQSDPRLYVVTVNRPS